MPRAFLITRRRYNGTGEFEETAREYSPERGVRLAEYGVGHQQPTSDGASECGSESSSECPEELYNLTKLAEVSLAAAAGTLVHPATSVYGHHQRPLVPIVATPIEPQRYYDEMEPDNQPVREFKSCMRDKKRFPGAGFGQSDDRQQHQQQQQRMTTMSIAPGQGQQPEEEHECPDCGKKYSTSSNLARHRQTHRSLGDKKARHCPHCDKVYVSIPAFSMHVRTHNQGCKCHFCGKCFSRPWLLQGHIRTHTGEKPFKCTICNKAFADKSNLRAHIQTHSNTKPHVCGRCGKAFALKSYLYKHEESSCMRSSQQQQQQQKRDSPTAASQPTSVIVPPRSAGSSAFSAIIRHTEQEDLTASGMVVRTSVISPNPEHLAVRKMAQQQQQQTPFDFDDPARLSAFSRPQPVNLNLAIA